MQKRILSAFIALAIIISVGASVPVIAAETVAGVKADIEQKYGVRIDVSKTGEISDEDKISHIHTIGYYLSLIPSELHSVLMMRLKAQNLNFSIRIDFISWWSPGSYSLTDINATIILSVIDLGTFAHEYGHMLHYELQKIYGKTKFTNEWVALNDGASYVGDNWANNTAFDKDTFVRDYATSSIDEDVAEIFELFTAHQFYVRTSYDTMKNTNIWKKAMLLEKISKETLKIDRIYFPTYIPQTPSPWAADTVKRAFAGGWNGEQYIRKMLSEDMLLYQEAISREMFYKYTIFMTDSVCYKKYERSVVDNAGYLYPQYIPRNIDILNPATGELTQGKGEDGPIGIATHLGIITGVGDGLHDLAGNLTREEAAVILTRVHRVLGIKDTGGAKPFIRDSASVSPESTGSVDYVLRNGIMGYTDEFSNFSPKMTYTYEQAIAALVRLYDMAVAMQVK